MTMAESSQVGVYVVHGGAFCYINPIGAAYAGYRVDVTRRDGTGPLSLQHVAAEIRFPSAAAWMPVSKILKGDGSFAAFPHLLLDEPFGRLDQVVVEPSTESPVGGHTDHAEPLGFADRQQRVAPGIHPECEAVQNLHELHGVRPEILHAHLGGLELRGRHHIHRPGDLPGFLNSSDLSFNVFKCRHSHLTP